jgi:hypothetical protein
MTKINKGVEKVHSKHHGVELNMKFLFFWEIECIKTLKIEGIGYNVNWHWKTHKGCCGL